MEDHPDSSNEGKDVKINPIIFPVSTKISESSETTGLSPSLVSGSKKWSPRSLQDGNRKSAFQPYKQYTSTNTTVLTNLQRGNTQAETPSPQATELNFHTKAGQGELTEQELINEQDVDAVDCNGLTPLHWASACGQYNTVQLLVNHGADVNKFGPEEETPLILAAGGGHHEVVRLLIATDADVNHADHLCNTALMYAARGNHPHTCQELLLHGANFSLINLNDDTAHVIAVENNSTAAQTVIENFIIAKIEASSP